MEMIEKQRLDEERALYGVADTLVRDSFLTARPTGRAHLRRARD